jgi:hypothetical protein
MAMGRFGRHNGLFLACIKRLMAVLPPMLRCKIGAVG